MFYRKSSDIIGVAIDGALYCLACGSDDLKREPGVPLFVDNSDGTETCDTCGINLLEEG